VPVTFLSAAVQFATAKAIRGGIPICWPWFGAHPTDRTAPSHGFARTAMWRPQDLRSLPGGATQLTLRLTDRDATHGSWPPAFTLDYVITVGESLDLELVTTNNGSAPFTISEALHTYCRVGDVGAARVLGLDGVPYADSADGGRRERQSGAVVFEGEVDRVYLGTDARCVLDDPLLKRRILIDKCGSRSTVVWNPGAGKAAKLGDLTDATPAAGSWRQLVCIETANALDDSIAVAPGQSHVLRARIQAETLSV
jgi:D-hexose-6-phosphate mutarotase